MRQRYFRSALAILLLFAVHLHPVCLVTVDGQRVEGCYSPSRVRDALRCAEAAAEELTTGESVLPPLRRSFRLRLRAPDGSAAPLTDALLQATEGVTQADGVSVNGQALGTVADGQAMLAQLQAAIRRDMPETAAVGNLSGRLAIHPVYTRAGCESGSWDMILRITALAPVFYLDSLGKLV